MKSIDNSFTELRKKKIAVSKVLSRAELIKRKTFSRTVSKNTE